MLFRSPQIIRERYTHYLIHLLCISVNNPMKRGVPRCTILPPPKHPRGSHLKTRKLSRPSGSRRSKSACNCRWAHKCGPPLHVSDLSSRLRLIVKRPCNKVQAGVTGHCNPSPLEFPNFMYRVNSSSRKNPHAEIGGSLF